MTAIRFRNPEVRMSAALAAAEDPVRDPVVTLRELLASLGEQGLLVFCGVLAAPFLLPVTVPGMSTVLGLPMLLIGFAVMVSRVPWLPERLLNHSLPAPRPCATCCTGCAAGPSASSTSCARAGSGSPAAARSTS